MMYVVDASLAVKWFIPEPLSDEAMKLLANFRSKISDLTAPDLIVVEVGSALWKRSTLRNEISELEAAESHADFLALGLEFHSTPPLVRAALNLQLRNVTRHTIWYMSPWQNNSAVNLLLPTGG
jgi:predicted nucleic acid-binding protein